MILCIISAPLASYYHTSLNGMTFKAHIKTKKAVKKVRGKIFMIIFHFIFMNDKSSAVSINRDLHVIKTKKHD